MVRRLPADACFRRQRAEIGRDRWDLNTELLAQLIEVMSIPAAERRLSEPVQVPRPKYVEEARTPSGPGRSRAMAIMEATARGTRRVAS